MYLMAGGCFLDGVLLSGYFGFGLPGWRGRGWRIVRSQMILLLRYEVYDTRFE